MVSKRWRENLQTFWKFGFLAVGAKTALKTYQDFKEKHLQGHKSRRINLEDEGIFLHFVSLESQASYFSIYEGLN